jgi:hypothetical protein
MVLESQGVIPLFLSQVITVNTVKNRTYLQASVDRVLTKIRIGSALGSDLSYRNFKGKTIRIELKFYLTKAHF